MVFLFGVILSTKVNGQDSSSYLLDPEKSPFDSSESQPLKKTRNIFGFIPNKNTKQINGVSIGLCLNPYDSLKINGLNIEVLGGWLVSPQLLDEKTSFNDTTKMNQVYYKKYTQVINGITVASIAGFNNAQVNGATVSFFYNCANEVNGISVSFLGNTNQFFNGIELALLTNEASRGRGIQISLINKCYNFRGIQLGLWNKNGKRSLPLINWQFKP